jgi:hypothetical protein
MEYLKSIPNILVPYNLILEYADYKDISLNINPLLDNDLLCSCVFRLEEIMNNIVSLALEQTEKSKGGKKKIYSLYEKSNNKIYIAKSPNYFKYHPRKKMSCRIKKDGKPERKNCSNLLSDQLSTVHYLGYNSDLSAEYYLYPDFEEYINDHKERYIYPPISLKIPSPLPNQVKKKVKILLYNIAYSGKISLIDENLLLFEELFNIWTISISILSYACFGGNINMIKYIIGKMLENHEEKKVFLHIRNSRWLLDKNKVGYYLKNLIEALP